MKRYLILVVLAFVFLSQSVAAQDGPYITIRVERSNVETAELGIGNYPQSAASLALYDPNSIIVQVSIQNITQADWKLPVFEYFYLSDGKSTVYADQYYSPQFNDGNVAFFKPGETKLVNVVFTGLPAQFNIAQAYITDSYNKIYIPLP